MTARSGQERRELPIGRRVAQLRVRRGMSQQAFADRIGKSKSWVDKVERGVRKLDRLSVIETIAGVLGVATGVLVGRDVQQATVTEVAAAVERVREAWPATTPSPPPADAGPPPSNLAGRSNTRVRRTGTPSTRSCCGSCPTCSPTPATLRRPAAAPTAHLLVRVYRLAAQILVKLGEPAPGLARRRPGDDRCRRRPAAYRHRRSASRAGAPRPGPGPPGLSVAITALHQLDAASPPKAPPERLALAGTLLIEAALAAASYGDATTAHATSPTAPAGWPTTTATTASSGRSRSTSPGP